MSDKQEEQCHGNSPGYHYGELLIHGEPVVAVPICDKCGAIVWESEPHDKYHEDVEAIAVSLQQLMVQVLSAHWEHNNELNKTLKFWLSSTYGRRIQFGGHVPNS